MKPSQKVPCPHCKKMTFFNDNPYRPFCSERCKLIDLGQWAEGDYRIAGQPLSDIDLPDTETLQEEE